MKTPFQRFLEELPETFAYQTGTTLIGLNIKWKSGTWLMVVTRIHPANGKEVAFIETGELLDTYRYLYAHLSTKAAPLKWAPSKY